MTRTPNYQGVNFCCRVEKKRQIRQLALGKLSAHNLIRYTKQPFSSKCSLKHTLNSRQLIDENHSFTDFRSNNYQSIKICHQRQIHVGIRNLQCI